MERHYLFGLLTQGELVLFLAMLVVALSVFWVAILFALKQRKRLKKVMEILKEINWAAAEDVQQYLDKNGGNDEK